jgi:myo-inositol 2-dehydrogenase / D-chiro-inositol 1-dehydrogenase
VNPTDQLRLGILGAGRIGSMHADLLANRVATASVTGVFDVAQTQAEQVAAAIGTRRFASVAELINRHDVDAVVIATSTDTHVELIEQAAAAGKAIFCEKPISLELAPLDKALAAVAEAGVALHVGFNRRFDPGHAALRAAVADGTLGQLRQVRITSRDPAPPPIAYVTVSGGIFCDMTIHDFDMARFVTGSEVVEVYAKGDVRVDPAIGTAGDLDTVVVMLTHADGTLTTIDNCRQAVYGYDQRVEAFGSGGMAISENQLDHNTVTRTAEGGHTAKVPYFFLDRYIPSYLAQWEAFVDAVRHNRPTPVSGADSRAPLVMGLAAQRSVAEQRPVSLAEIDRAGS